VCVCLGGEAGGGGRAPVPFVSAKRHSTKYKQLIQKSVHICAASCDEAMT
jgi:hypothetical protein